MVWRLASAGEVPADNAWLLPAEQVTLAGLAHPKRRSDWRLGRWVAKQTVGTLLGTPPAAVEIHTDPDGSPYACCAGAPVAGAFSISHRAELGLCVAVAPPLAIGCDLELVETRAPVFEDDWFTSAERTLVAAAAAGDHDVVVTLIWSAKESALKALRSGLRRDTRTVVVDAIGDAPVDGWRSLHVSDALGTGFAGWWRLDGRFMITVAGASMPVPPSRIAESLPGG